jgi:hypothetical protein
MLAAWLTHAMRRWLSPAVPRRVGSGWRWMAARAAISLAACNDDGRGEGNGLDNDKDVDKGNPMMMMTQSWAL